MANTPKTPDLEIARPADKVIDTVTLTQQEALQAMEVASTTLFTGLNEMQREVADFVAKRIREDMETQQDLLRCRNLDDVREVQSRFFRTAMDQYSAETTRLMQLATETMQKPFARD